jgi:hypothetical protein
MHARLDDLIRLRTALRQLPQFEPPPQAWDHIASRLAASAVQAPAPGGQPASLQSRRRVPASAAAVLAVASLAAVLASAAWWPTAHEARQGAGTAGLANDPPVAALMARSQALEEALQSLPQRPAAELAANAVAIDALQARIRVLDAALAGDPVAGGNVEQARELWGARVQLLNSLVGVRYAEAVRAGYTTSTSQGEI